MGTDLTTTTNNGHSRWNRIDSCCYIYCCIHFWGKESPRAWQIFWWGNFRIWKGSIRGEKCHATEQTQEQPKYENRQKLEAIVDTLGTKHSDKNRQELRAAIQREIDKDRV